MTVIPLGLSTYKRTDARTPEILLKNMLVEKDPTNLVDGWVRIQRPAIKAFATVGDGPIRGMLKQKGTFNGDFLVVSGGELWRVTEGASKSKLGDIGGVSRVQMAASATRCLIATGDICYSTDGVTVTTVHMPDDLPVFSVEYINGYFLLSITGSQHIYYMAPGEVDPDALSFFSAESSPDNVVCLKRIGDEFWAFGDSTVEPFTPTGDADLPFSPIQGRVYEKGCANRDTVVEMDNTLFWVGADKIAYRGDNVPIRVSDNGIEEKLRRADAALLRAWAFEWTGHTIYCLTIGDEGTYYYDVASQQWGQFSTYARTIWRCHLGAQTSGSLVVAGDDRTGDLWQLTQDQANDAGEPLIREITGGAPVNNALGEHCGSLSVYVATGWANLNPPANDPVLEVRYSDDGGNTWGNWIQMPLRGRGQFTGEIGLFRLGMMYPPYRVFHFRMSEDTVFRISYAKVNDFRARPR